MRILRVIFCVLAIFWGCQKNTTDKKQSIDFDSTNSVISQPAPTDTTTKKVGKHTYDFDNLETILKNDFELATNKLLSKYGSPVNIKYDTRLKHHPDFDSIITISFSGFSVELLYTTKDKRYYLGMVDIGDSTIMGRYGFSKGMVLDSLRRDISLETFSQYGDVLELEHYINPDNRRRFRFIFRKNQLEGVQYTIYVDE